MSEPDVVPVANATPVPEDFAAGVAARLAERRGQSERAPDTKPEYGPLHEAAAVLASFDCEAICPVPGAGKDERIEALLKDSVQAVQPGGVRRWMLTPEARVATLRQLRERDRVGEALAANPAPQDDLLQRTLEAHLTGRAPALDRQSLSELAATRQVCEWLRAAGFPGVPEQADIEQRIDWLSLLQPFEHLAGAHFRGRVEELARLRSYAEVQPPGSAFESVRRVVDSSLGRQRRLPLVIYGPGGVGKSTLMARFILEHARALEEDRFPFAYLDFDRPDVSGHEPLTLLSEAVRQLGIEYPSARESCERIRREWLDRLVQTPPAQAEGSAVSGHRRVAAGVRSAAVADFASLIASLGADGRPVLFVLDTFEEVQWRSDEHVAAIWRLLEDLRSAVPRLRVVVVGRAHLPGHSAIEMPLLGLDDESAVGYLLARGIRDVDVARRLAHQVGGSPLSLKLAADLAVLEGLDTTGKLELSTRGFLFLRVDDALIQRQLYRRVLGHVHNPEVRKLAHPGLVLRRLTPELIFEVLREPCDLAASSLPEARELFEELRREVSLVTMESDGALRHRPDLRRLMLALLETDEPEKTRMIHERAVAYYQRQAPEPALRAEEIYHRLALGHEPAEVDARWLPGVEPYLAGALDEFSGVRKARLASRLGLEVDPETRRLADREDWERLVERKVRGLLEEEPEEALKLLGSRSDRMRASPLVALEATALMRLHRWADSLAVLERGMDRAVADGERGHAIALALLAAEIVLTSRRTDDAPPLLARLEELSKGSVTPSTRLGLVARRLALARLDPSVPSETVSLERELGEAFDALPDEALAARPALACWAAASFGREDVGRLARALRVAGLPRADTSSLRHLAAGLTSFDVAVSKDLGEAPGALARSVGVPVGGSVTAAWTGFVLTAPPKAAGGALARVLEEEARFVPSGVVDALAQVMRAELGIEKDPSGVPAEPAAAHARRERKKSRSGETKETLARVLREMFPSVALLREFLRFRLERNLDAVAPADTLNGAVIRLVEAADREGWLLPLVVKAREAHPNHAGLAPVAEELGLAMLSPETGSSSLESVLHAPFLDPVLWRERLGLIEGQVCRVEVGGRAQSTGFLVGVDLVLTISHALDGNAPRNEVQLRFDMKTDQRGRLITGGTVFSLHRDWLVARSEFRADPAGLGYALLRVRNSPGAQPIGGGGAESSAVLRRWIEVRDPPPTATRGEGLMMLQHPAGGPLKLAFNPEGVVGLSRDGARLYHVLESLPGSSGAPCFTMNLDLLAFHLGTAGADPAAPRNAKVGVLIAAVLRDLRARGLGELLGTRFV